MSEQLVCIWTAGMRRPAFINPLASRTVRLLIMSPGWQIIILSFSILSFSHYPILSFQRARWSKQAFPSFCDCFRWWPKRNKPKDEGSSQPEHLRVGGGGGARLSQRRWRAGARCEGRGVYQASGKRCHQRPLYLPQPLGLHGALQPAGVLVLVAVRLRLDRRARLHRLYQGHEIQRGPPRRHRR